MIFNDLQMIFNDFQWCSMIFNDFHWFSMILNTPGPIEVPCVAHIHIWPIYDLCSLCMALMWPIYVLYMAHIWPICWSQMYHFFRKSKNFDPKWALMTSPTCPLPHCPVAPTPSKLAKISKHEWKKQHFRSMILNDSQWRSMIFNDVQWLSLPLDPCSKELSNGSPQVRF